MPVPQAKIKAEAFLIASSYQGPTRKAIARYLWANSCRSLTRHVPCTYAGWHRCLPFLRAQCHDQGFPLKSVLLIKAVISPCYVHSHPIPFGSTTPYAATAEVLHGCKQIILRIRQFIWLAWKSSCWLEGGQEHTTGVRQTGPYFSGYCGLRSTWMNHLERAEGKKLHMYLSSFHISSSPVTDWPRCRAMLILVVNWPHWPLCSLILTGSLVF